MSSDRRGTIIAIDAESVEMGDGKWNEPYFAESCWWYVPEAKKDTICIVTINTKNGNKRTFEISTMDNPVKFCSGMVSFWYLEEI